MNIKKNKFLAMCAPLAMGLLLTACGGGNDAGTAGGGGGAGAGAGTGGGAAAGGDEQIVLNFAHWNNQIVYRFNAVVDLPENVTVNWIFTPNENNAYQNELIRQLPAGELDMFVVEADHILNFVDSGLVMDIRGDLGFTEAQLGNMFDYTLEIATDSNGVLRGVTAEANPGLFVYRRSFAQQVLGSDDPAVVQSYISNWADFTTVAERMNEHGIHMLSGFDDAYRVFANNVSAPWVNANHEIIVDDNLWTWVDQTMYFTENGFNNMGPLWSEEWSQGKAYEGTVFGYFHAPWGINFVHLGASLADENAPHELGNGSFGDWGAVQGPQGFFWGGTWIMAYSNSPHADIIADIMYQLTVNEANLEQMVTEFQDFVNNRAVVERIANSDFSSAFLGGQNHIALLAGSADTISMAHVSPFDQGLTESFQDAFGDYFEGIVDRETALNNFMTTATTLYPILSRPAQ